MTDVLSTMEVVIQGNDKLTIDLKKVEAGVASFVAKVNSSFTQIQTNSIADSLEKTNVSVNQALHGFESSIIRTVGAISAAWLGVKLVGFPIQEAAEFQKEMINVQRTTQFTDGTIKLLASDFLKMATEIPVAAQELAQIASLAGRFGVGHEGWKGLSEFTATIARFAADTGVSVEKSAISFGKLLNIFNLPIDKVENLSSALVRVAHSSKVLPTELLDATQRLGSAGGLLKSWESISLSATGISLGQTPETTGTGLIRIFSTMEAKNRDFARFMETSTEEWAQTVRTKPVLAFQMVLDKMRELESAARAERITALLSQGGRQLSLVNKLLEDRAAGVGSVLNQSLRNAEVNFVEGFAALKEQQTTLRGVSAQFQLLKNSFSSLSTELGSAQIPALTEFMHFLRTAANSSEIRQLFFGVGDSILHIIKVISGLNDRFVDFKANITNVINILDKFIQFKAIELGFLALKKAMDISGVQRFSAALVDMSTKYALSMEKFGTRNPLVAYWASAKENVRNYWNEVSGVTRAETLQAAAVAAKNKALTVTADAHEAAARAAQRRQSIEDRLSGVRTSITNVSNTSTTALTGANNAIASSFSRKTSLEQSAAVERKVLADMVRWEAEADDAISRNRSTTRMNEANIERNVRRKLNTDMEAMAAVHAEKMRQISALGTGPNAIPLTQVTARQAEETRIFYSELAKRNAAADTERVARLAAYRQSQVDFAKAELEKVAIAKEAAATRLREVSKELTEATAAHKAALAQKVVIEEEAETQITALRQREAAIRNELDLVTAQAAHKADKLAIAKAEADETERLMQQQANAATTTMSRAAGAILGTVTVVRGAISLLGKAISMALNVGLWISIGVAVLDMLGWLKPVTDAVLKLGEAFGFATRKRDEMLRKQQEAREAEAKLVDQDIAARMESAKSSITAESDVSAMRGTLTSKQPIEPTTLANTFATLNHQMAVAAEGVEATKRQLTRDFKLEAKVTFTQDTESLRVVKERIQDELSRIERVRTGGGTLTPDQQADWQKSVQPDIARRQQLVADLRVQQASLEKDLAATTNAIRTNGQQKVESLQKELEISVKNLNATVKLALDTFSPDTGAMISLLVQRMEVDKRVSDARAMNIKVLDLYGKNREATVADVQGLRDLPEVVNRVGTKNEVKTAEQALPITQDVVDRALDAQAKVNATYKEAFAKLEALNAADDPVAKIVITYLQQVEKGGLAQAATINKALQDALAKGATFKGGAAKLRLTTDVEGDKNYEEFTRGKLKILRSSNDNLFAEAQAQSTRMLELDKAAQAQGLLSAMDAAERRMAVERDILNVQIANKQANLELTRKVANSDTTKPADQEQAKLEVNKYESELKILEAQRKGLEDSFRNTFHELRNTVNDATAELQATLLQMQGQEANATLTKLEATYRDRLNAIQAMRKSPIEAIRNLGDVQFNIVAKLVGKDILDAQLRELETNITRTSDYIQAVQNRVTAEVAVGVQQEIAGQEAVVRARQEYADVIQTKVIPALAAQRAEQARLGLDTREMDLRIEGMRTQYIELANAISDTAKSINDTTRSSLVSMFTDMTTGAKTAKTAIDDMLRSVRDRVLNAIVSVQVDTMFGDLFKNIPGSMGDAISKAFGGQGKNTIDTPSNKMWVQFDQEPTNGVRFSLDNLAQEVTRVLTSLTTEVTGALRDVASAFQKMPQQEGLLRQGVDVTAPLRANISSIPAASQPLAQQINAEMSSRGVDPAFALALWKIETGGKFSTDPKLRNASSGATGPFQIMPSTFEGLKKKYPQELTSTGGIETADLAMQIKAFGLLVSELNTTFKGNVEKMAAGYHAGPGSPAVQALQAGKEIPAGITDGITRTRDYVARVSADTQKFSVDTTPMTDTAAAMRTMYQEMGKTTLAVSDLGKAAQGASQTPTPQETVADPQKIVTIDAATQQPLPVDLQEIPAPMQQAFGNVQPAAKQDLLATVTTANPLPVAVVQTPAGQPTTQPPVDGSILDSKDGRAQGITPQQGGIGNALLNTIPALSYMLAGSSKNTNVRAFAPAISILTGGLMNDAKAAYAGKDNAGNQGIISGMTDFFSSVEGYFVKGMDGLKGLFSDSGALSGFFDSMGGWLKTGFEWVSSLFAPSSGGAGAGAAAGASGGGWASWVSMIAMAMAKDGGLITTSWAKSGLKGFAEGGAVTNGVISGPGTGTSDSILALVNQVPIRVANGEYIMPAHVTSQWLPIFNAIRTGALSAADFLARGASGAKNVTPISAWHGYAEGGLVGTSSTKTSPMSEVSSGNSDKSLVNNNSFRIINVLDPSLVGDYLASSHGERGVLNVIRRNSATIRQVVKSNG